MTAGDPQHPSYLALDRIALGLSVPDTTRRHVEACTRCSTHVDRCKSPRPIPKWVKRLAEARPTQPLRAWVAASVGATAIAAIALLVSRPVLDTTEQLHTTVRGAPSVGLYIKHGTRVELWDGHQPIHPGDVLRLKVVPEGFTHVGVFAQSRLQQGRPRQLFAAELDPAVATLLPRAWLVDGTPDDELLLVVLAQRPVREDDLASDGRDPGPRDQLWVRTLVLHKTQEFHDAAVKQE